MYKVIYLVCILISIASFACKQKETKSLRVSENTNSTTIKISFKSKGKIYLDYLDSNYRNSVIAFINPFNADTSIIKTIESNKPTIYNFNFLDGGILYKQPYIGLNNSDTIEFIANNDKLLASPRDLKNQIFSEVIKPQNLKFYYANFSLDTFNKHNQYLVMKYSEAFNLLMTKVRKTDTLFISTVQHYLTLQYFTNSLNFLKQANNQIPKEAIFIYDSLQKNSNFLSQFSCPDMKSLLFSVLNFPKNNLKPINSLTAKLEAFPKSFTKTKYLDGFLFDLIETKSKTIYQMNLYLDSISGFLYSPIKSKNFELKKLPDSILNNPLVSIKLEKKRMSEIIQTKKKIILLDFWASWCKPCIEQINHLNRKEFSLKNDVEIIRISLDDNYQIWLDAAKKHHQLQNSYKLSKETNNSLVQFFSLSTIPRYVLITNSGYVIADNFYKPSEENFVLELQKAIETVK
jgi:thiol-disulfide isomerase/thioredoxin